MRNRHTFLLFLAMVMSIMLFTNGCAKSSNQDNEKITDKVIELEKNYYLLHSAQMSYTEYLSNVEPIIFSNSSYLDMYEKKDMWVKMKNIYNSQFIDKKEIMNASNEELKSIRDRLTPKDIPAKDILVLGEVKISKIYDNDKLKEKIVFATQLEDAKQEGFDIMNYRRYIFRNIDKEWKLFEMRSTIVAGYDNPKGGHIVTPQDETNLFEEYNNEKVVYDTTINLEQYDIK